MKSSFIDKILSRLENLSHQQVEVLVDKLAREKGLLEQILEALQEGVILFDLKGVTMFMNQAAERLFGLQEQNCTGKSLNELLVGIDLERFAPDEASVVSQDLEILYPERRLLNIYSAPIRETIALEKESSKAGRVLLIRDITSQQEETEQFLESERFNALSLLAAGVAHEIGNPLNSLGIQLQLLRRKLNNLTHSEGQKMREHVEKAQQEISRLDHILKDFLHAIRPSEPKREPEDLHLILRETITGLEEELTKRKTKIRLSIASSMPQLLLDKGKIRQALYNVIRNASQSMSANGGEIIIITQVTEFEIQLQVKDSGSGIAPEDMGRLYEPFHTQKKGTGTGLGLLIVRRIIREHGGDIKIESKLGEGTKVSFFFPRHDQKAKLLAHPSEWIEVTKKTHSETQN